MAGAPSGPDFAAYVAATVAASAASAAKRDAAAELEAAARKLRTPPRGMPAVSGGTVAADEKEESERTDKGK